ncbi:MAG: hypothetical protein ACLFPN_01640 [Methanomassiliicoccales archaeon]
MDQDRFLPEGNTLCVDGAAFVRVRQGRVEVFGAPVDGGVVIRETCPSCRKAVPPYTAVSTLRVTHTIEKK